MILRALGLFDRIFLAPLRHRKIEKVLFLCKGNICRSPYAARRLAGLGGPTAALEIASAGLDTTPGKPADETAMRVSKSRGTDLTEHRTARASTELIERSDLIVVMDRSHREALRRSFPQALEKMLYLGSLAPDLLEGFEIRDPFGLSEEAFVRCYARIDLALEKLVKLLSRAPSW